MSTPAPMYRTLLCPACTEPVRVVMPEHLDPAREEYVLPAHESRNGSGLCQTFQVTVTFALYHCDRCQFPTMLKPDARGARRCAKCFMADFEAERERLRAAGLNAQAIHDRLNADPSTWGEFSRDFKVIEGGGGK